VIDSIIDVDRLAPPITSKRLDEFTVYSCATQMRSEATTKTVRSQMTRGRGDVLLVRIKSTFELDGVMVCASASPSRRLSECSYSYPADSKGFVTCKPCV
jgi:hypothetical protein